MFLVALPRRGTIAVTGADRVAFLQGLVSNDVTLVTSGRAVWAAFLTPQGKWLADFFIFADDHRLLLDCERAQIPMLLAKLGRYRLRSTIGLADVSDDFTVHALWDGAPEPMPSVITAPDPRLPEAGWRLLSSVPLTPSTEFEAWDRHRLRLGLPDGSRDLESERTLLLEAGFAELGGVSWTKGCYLGQELTARTRYRGLIKRRLVPVAIAGPAPASATPILKDGIERGTMRSLCRDIGLASLRIDALGGPLFCGEALLEPRIPAWIELPPTQRPLEARAI